MKTKILDIAGNEKGSVDLPKCFSAELREDIISKVVEAQKVHQAYGAMPLAGMQSSASGKLVHRRGVWKSQYKKGISRIPRKIMSRRGTQFNWTGAFIPSTVGGRRAHPPKAFKDWSKQVNKKEIKLAFYSALSATTMPEVISKRYATLDVKDIKQAPFIVESKLSTLKTKELLSSLKKILGDKLFGLAVRTKSIRAGIGKLRGRKYKSNAGLLLVVGKDEKIKTSAFEVQSVNELNVTDLAKGGPGRLTIYTDSALKDLEEKFSSKKTKKENTKK